MTPEDMMRRIHELSGGGRFCDGVVVSLVTDGGYSRDLIEPKGAAFYARCANLGMGGDTIEEALRNLLAKSRAEQAEVLRKEQAFHREQLADVEKGLRALEDT